MQTLESPTRSIEPVSSRWPWPLLLTGVLIVAVTVAVLVLRSGGSVFDALDSGGEGVSMTIPDGVDSFASLIQDPHGADAVVVGTVVEVDIGKGFRWELDSEGEEVRIEEPFNGPDAWVSTVHVTLAVQEVIYAASGQPGLDSLSTVTFGLSFNSPVEDEAFVEELTDLGELVVFLHESPVYDYQPGLWGVMMDGRLLGVVDEEGSISFPAYETEPLFGSPPSSLEELRALAS